MMIKKIILCSIAGLMITCQVYADLHVDGNITANNVQNFPEKMIVDGNATTKNSGFTSINVDGSLHTSNSIFTGNTVVNGAFSGDNSKFGSATMNGSFKCNVCTFNKNLHISSDAVTFSTVKAKNIIIQTQSTGLFSSKKTASLYLKNNSVVDNITFQNGQGVVYTSKNSKITGKVVNGKIVSQ